MSDSLASVLSVADGGLFFGVHLIAVPYNKTCCETKIPGSLEALYLCGPPHVS